MGKKVKILIFIVINIIVIYWLWYQKPERTTLSFGMFSFELVIDESLKPLKQAISYIESYEIDEKKNNLALESLSNYYIAEDSSKNTFNKVRDTLIFWKKRESKKIILRRLLAKLLAYKMGKITAAEELLKTNIGESNNYKDIIFLGSILSNKPEINNEEILSQYKTAIELKDCKKDTSSYKIALMNIYLREGHILFNNEQYDEAIEKYLKVLDIFDCSYAAYSGLGNSYIKKQDRDNAIRYYDKVIAYSNNDSHTSDALYNKSQLIFHVDKNATFALRLIDMGLKIIEEKYSKFPIGSEQKNDLANRYFFRGVIYKSIGKLIAAKDDFLRCKQISVDNGQIKECQKQLTKIHEELKAKASGSQKP